MSYVGDQCRSKTQDWFSNKDSNNEGNPQAVFNALDLILKENLDRLKTMRSAFQHIPSCSVFLFIAVCTFAIDVLWFLIHSCGMKSLAVEYE